MTIEVQIEAARNPWWEEEQMHGRFGVNPFDEASGIPAQFKIWAASYARRGPVMKPGLIHRFEFERFLQSREVLPIRYAALHLGISVRSFQDLLAAMISQDLLAEPETWSPMMGMYSTPFIRSLYKRFGRLQHKVFSSHGGFVRSLHEEVHGVLGLAVTPVHCTTSKALGEDPVEPAVDFDILTDDPIGLEYQVWLDFKKPISLRPDACSTITYLRHERVLDPYLLAKRDGMVDELRTKLPAQV